MRPTLAEIMLDVAKLEAADSEMSRAVVRGIIAVKVGCLCGLDPVDALAAVRKPALAVVRDVPWVEL